MMKRKSPIFAKLRLRPGQLRAVAEQRFADANCLLAAKRANGAIYMAGFVIECLLKAMLLERHPNLEVPVDPAKLSEQDREVFELLFRHDLDRMLPYVPEIAQKLAEVTVAGGRSAWRALRDLCEEWTVYARYSPAHANIAQATEFLQTIEEVKIWLREL